MVVAWSLTYIVLMTFAVPGTSALSLLGGAIFGLKVGFPVVAGESAPPRRRARGGRADGGGRLTGGAAAACGAFPETASQ